MKTPSRPPTLSVPSLLFAILALAGLALLSGCAASEESSTIPWSQPSGWEGSVLPGVMPNYGERNY